MSTGEAYYISVLIVFRYRVKSLSGHLKRQAEAVNFVWNYCNDRQKDAVRYGRPWLSAFDLNRLTSGSSKELGLHSETISATCEQYAKSRSQRRRPYLRYRGKKSLGWVPVKGRYLKETAQGFRFNGREFKVFKSRSLPADAGIRDGSGFSQDARGNWFLNICIRLPQPDPGAPRHAVGIDLGLAHLATLSTGEKIGNPRVSQRFREAIARANRAKKRRQLRKLHAKVAYIRSDFLHKTALDLVRRFDVIAVGDVSPSATIARGFGRAVSDVGWSSFRNMLRYKAIAHGARYVEVDEAFSTQTCSRCSAIPPERPQGIAGLGIRRWTCSVCGAEHDRDVNAARNILARSGHRAPAEGVLG